MKKHIVCMLLMLIIGICNNAAAQVLKYKARQASLKLNESKSEREWIPCNTLVVVDTAKQTIVIYKEQKEKFDIIKSLDSRRENNHTTVAFQAVDNDGKEVTMSLSIVHDKDYNALLVVLYKEYSFAYKLIAN